MLKKLIKKIRCKIVCCYKSECSMNDETKKTKETKEINI